MRKTFLVMFALLLAIFPVFSTTQAQEVRDPAIRGVEWLASQQNKNGSFAEDVGVTAYAIISFVAVGESNQAAVDWIEGVILENGEELGLEPVSLAVTAVVASGVDPYAFAGGKLMEVYIGKSRSEASNLSLENVNAVCAALTGLVNLGLPLPANVIADLLALQQEDGSFPSGSEELTAVSRTAFCLNVLVAAEQTEAVEKALEYLRRVQNSDNGWSISTGVETSDVVATAFGIQALLAADQDLAEWNSPEFTLVGLQDRETGAFAPLPGLTEDPDIITVLSIASTVLAVPVLRGIAPIDIKLAAPEETAGDEGESAEGEGPALSLTWKTIADGFGMDELDTADDFFVTVVDPFTNDELYGVEIINWTAEYQYTGFIVETALPAEVLLWMAEQDPATWDNISEATLRLLPAAEFEKLPADIQALVER